MTPKLRFPEFKDNWKLVRLNEVASLVNGLTYDPSMICDEGILVLRSSNVQNGILTYADNVFVDVTDYNSVKEGDVLMCVRNGSRSLIGKTAVIDKAAAGLAFGAFMVVVRSKSIENQSFLSQVFQTNIFFRDVHRNLGATINSINNSSLNKFQFGIPSNTTETKKLGSFFELLSYKINLLTKKKEALETYKKGLMQKIFSQELRFKRENGTDYPEWKKIVYSEFLKERDDKHPQSDEFPLCSFVAHKGVVPKGDRYNREFLVNDKKGKKYKRTKKDDFIYSSNNLETGSIGLNEYGNGCISPVYSVFSIDKGCDINFIAHYLVTKANLHKMIRFRQGVMYGQWRIHETDFLKIKVAIPSNEEQKHIGEILESMNSGLEELERLISATSKLKKGLLQQMFA